MNAFHQNRKNKKVIILKKAIRKSGFFVVCIEQYL